MSIHVPRKLSHLVKASISGPIWLGIYREKNPPKWSPNFIRAIVQFARFKGLTIIPQKTVNRLKSDPYFKYCFSDLVSYTDPYKRTSFLMADVKERFQRLIELINKPENVTDQDIYFGLSLYMNNFPAFMPGGSARKCFLKAFFEEAEPSKHLVEIKREIDAIDTILIELGLVVKAIQLGEAYSENFTTMAIAEKAEYMKICIDVFEVLMNKYGFTWKMLIG